jgi:3-deoxy-D-manno-octulosonic-acid transferase
MKLAYNIIIAAALLLTSPYWIIRMGLDPAFRSELIQRTRQWKSIPRQTGCLWVHASSVGEVRVAELLIQALQQRYPGRTVVLSTFTATGYALAKEAIECPVFRLPLDLPFLIRPLLKRLDPAILILIEAEYWPNLLRACLQRKIPVLLANGRLSAKSFDRYQKLKPWFLWITEPITTFSMRAQAEADRLLRLNIDPARMQVTGNMKFDSLTTDESPNPKPTQMDEITVVFGSTRPGEEPAIAKAIAQLSQNPLDCRFIIAPRHVPRCREVESILRDAGLSVTLHSDRKDLTESWTGTVLLVDALGMLNDYYRQGHVAFVGGGFDSRHGGHNILEPALLGLPVIYGKDMGNFEEEARLLAESGGGIQIERPEDLTPALEQLLSDPEEIVRRGALAAEAVQLQKGAVNRNLDLIQSLLEKGNPT